MPHSAPVGVFDSGYGGISVLRSVRAMLPHESYLYFGDNANAPYGVRPGEEIRRLSLAAGQRLADQGVKAIVIACNTATGTALSALRAAFSMPVIGIQPALEAAQRLRRDGKVLALATPATFQTDTYAALYARHGQHTISLPCPGLMEFVEREELTGARLHAFLERLFSPYLNEPIDAVVLGCTHYPFLKDEIAGFFPDAVLVDASTDTAQQLKSALAERNLLAPPGREGTVTFLSSAGPEAAEKMRRFYNLITDSHT